MRKEVAAGGPDDVQAQPEPHTIRTFSGRIVRPFDLRPEDVDVRDIAHHLSKQCRFAGAIAGDETIYSVAEHAVRVSEEVEKAARALGLPEPEIRILSAWGLHHDDDEYVLPDLPGPIKHHAGMSFYRQAGKNALCVICRVLELPIEEPALVKEIDGRMAETEQRDIRGPRPDYGAAGTEGTKGAPFPEVIIPWTPAIAKARFLARAGKVSLRTGGTS